MSFWVTVPSYTARAPSPGADPVVLYIVEVGVQSHDGRRA
eukprot:CAMPEP_0183807708 /NCGR_PEP_ID=MMETSP0803_2-20130417/41935_1 /TAXON_ID=195967 /ORGANISM="Crustomastix stigmata, Strain CCMP3273" /LENGTH=39 /DNA_ID= /DNA_START= /DNA_END= /DNA_ORIENTATION=